MKDSRHVKFHRPIGVGVKELESLMGTLRELDPSKEFCIQSSHLLHHWQTTAKLFLRKDIPCEDTIKKWLIPPLAHVVALYVGHEVLRLQSNAPRRVPTIRSGGTVFANDVRKLLNFLSTPRTNQALFDYYLGQLGCCFRFYPGARPKQLMCCTSLDQAFRSLDCFCAQDALRPTDTSFIYRWTDPSKEFRYRPHRRYELVEFEPICRMEEVPFDEEQQRPSVSSFRFVSLGPRVPSVTS